MENSLKNRLIDPLGPLSASPLESESDRGTELYFSPKEVGEALGVSESSVKRWCDAGLIDNQKTSGGHRRVLISGVIDFVRRKNKKIISPEILGLRFLKLPKSLSDLRNLLLMMAGEGDVNGCRSLLASLYADRWGLEEILDKVVLPAVDSSRHSASVGHYRAASGIAASPDFSTSRSNGFDPPTWDCLRKSLKTFKSDIPRSQPKDLVAMGSHLGDLDSEMISLGIELILHEMGWNVPAQPLSQSPEGLILVAMTHNPALFYACLSSDLENDPEMSNIVIAMNRIARELTAGVPVLITRTQLPESLTSGLESVSSAYSLSHFVTVMKKLFVI
jgi:hypothetical protein